MSFMVHELKRILADDELIQSGLILASGNDSILIRSLTDDSRSDPSSSVFSGSPEGIPFLEDAYRKGFRIFLLPDDFTAELPADSTVLRSKNFFLTQGLLSSFLNGHPSRKIRLTGITGTNGKTTIAHMLYHIWKGRGLNAGMIGTMGVRYASGGEEKSSVTGYTTPRAWILHDVLREMTESGVTHAAMEVSSEALELGRTSGISFDSSVFTNLSQDHLDFHGTMDEYFRVKMKLFDATSGQMVVCTDSEYGKEALNYAKGIDESRTVEVSEPFVSDLPAPVYFNRMNASLAVMASSSRSEEQKEAVSQLRTLPEIKGRFEIIDSGEHFAVVDYAHTPDALKNLLTETRGYGAENICVVFGCGGNRDSAKRPQMGKIAGELSDFIIVTDDNPRKESPEKIRREIMEGIDAKEKAVDVSDRKKAIGMALEWMKSRSGRSACVIAGKGHEEYQIFSDRKESFSDRKCVEEFLSEAGAHG